MFFTEIFWDPRFNWSITLICRFTPAVLFEAITFSFDSLKERKGIVRDKEEDNLNDKSMIERAGVSVAMGNAVDEIKALAKHITLKNTEDGVAHAIYEFLGDN